MLKTKHTEYKCKDTFPAGIRAWGNTTMNLLSSCSLFLAGYASLRQNDSVKLLQLHQFLQELGLWYLRLVGPITMILSLPPSGGVGGRKVIALFLQLVITYN